MWTYHALLLFVCTLVAVNTGKTKTFSLVSVWMFYFSLSVRVVVLCIFGFWFFGRLVLCISLLFVVHVCILNRHGFGFVYFVAFCGACLYF